MNSRLYQEIRRIAAKYPETRAHLVPVLRKFASPRTACTCPAGIGHKAADYDASEDDEVMGGRTWGNPDPRSAPDDSVPYNKHEDSPPAGADGSPQRKKYNEWYRKNVCPKHKTNCGAPWLKGAAVRKMALDGPGGDMEAARDALVVALNRKGIPAEDSISINAFSINGNNYAIHGPEWIEGPGLGHGLRIQEKSLRAWIAKAVAGIAKTL